jgi:chromate transporter
VTAELVAPAAAGPTPRPPRARALRELAVLFVRLGLTAFGGPAAHVAMMEDEVVRRRRWMTREEFLDHYGASNLIPGPTSTELVIHIGHRMAGWPGLLVAGTCFIVPAALLTGTLAWAYVRFGALPQAGGILYGIKPVIIAVVIQALHGLGRAALKTPLVVAVAVAATVASLLGANVLAILFGAGALVAALRWLEGCSTQAAPPTGLAGTAWLGKAIGAAGGAAAAAAPVGLWPLFLLFVKVGAVLFGSGYVLLAFLREDLVERTHWLTPSQLIDAVAVGQFTPGPVFTTATFVGYVVAGPPGAVVATVGIFLPSFLLVLASGSFVPRLRRSPAAGAFLDGVNVASVALMAVVAVQLAGTALVDLTTAGLALASSVVLGRWRGRVNSAWLVVAGGVVGSVARAAGWVSL